MFSVQGTVQEFRVYGCEQLGVELTTYFVCGSVWVHFQAG